MGMDYLKSKNKWVAEQMRLLQVEPKEQCFVTETKHWFRLKGSVADIFDQRAPWFKSQWFRYWSGI